jgi:hypothetical protein
VLDVAEAIRAEVDRASKVFRGWNDGDVSAGPGVGKWNRKEILGHLIDSAANNHQRVVRGQFSSSLVFGYDQVAWVEANAYHRRAWSELVDLWVALKRHFAAAVEAVAAAKLSTPCAAGEEEAKPLEWWIRDYVRHMKHHVEQIERG